MESAFSRYAFAFGQVSGSLDNGLAHICKKRKVIMSWGHIINYSLLSLKYLFSIQISKVNVYTVKTLGVSPNFLQACVAIVEASLNLCIAI